MKKKIKVAVYEKVIETKEIELEYPKEPRYYKRFDDGSFFAEGLILFAIIPKYKDSTMLLIRVTKGRQDYNDFVPTKDCRQSYWLKSDETLRNEAFRILTTSHHGYEEICKQQFDSSRVDLLDCYKEYEIKNQQS